MQYFFSDFSYAPLVTAILVSILCTVLGYTLAFKIKYFDELAESPIVPPFIGIPTTFLALLIAFMAAAVWQNSSNAHAALQQERMALKKLYLMPVASAETLIKKEKYLDNYVFVVQQEEWGKSKNLYPSKDADAVLDSLLGFIFINQYDGLIQKKEFDKDAVKFIEELYAARDKRLSLGRMANFGYLNKWIIIYFLILISCFNISLVNRSKPKKAKSALIVFGFCCILVMSIVSLYIHPYKGPDALTASELSIKNKVLPGEK
jgi:hypothetical protein